SLEELVRDDRLAVREGPLLERLIERPHCRRRGAEVRAQELEQARHHLLERPALAQRLLERAVDDSLERPRALAPREPRLELAHPLLQRRGVLSHVPRRAYHPAPETGVSRRAPALPWPRSGGLGC